MSILSSRRSPAAATAEPSPSHRTARDIVANAYIPPPDPGMLAARPTPEEQAELDEALRLVELAAQETQKARHQTVVSALRGHEPRMTVLVICEVVEGRVRAAYNELAASISAAGTARMLSVPGYGFATMDGDDLIDGLPQWMIDEAGRPRSVLATVMP